MERSSKHALKKVRKQTLTISSAWISARKANFLQGEVGYRLTGIITFGRQSVVRGAQAPVPARPPSRPPCGGSRTFVANAAPAATGTRPKGRFMAANRRSPLHYRIAPSANLRPLVFLTVHSMVVLMFHIQRASAAPGELRPEEALAPPP